MDKKALSASKTYTDEKLKNYQCGDVTVTKNSDGSITFSANGGQSSVTLSPDEVKGLGIKKIEINSDNHLICTLDDDTTIDAGVLPSGSGTTDYEDLTNKPSTGRLELSGDKTLKELGINSLEDEFKDYSPNSEYKKDKYVFYDNVLYKINKDFISSDITTDVTNGNLVKYVGGSSYDDTSIKTQISNILKAIGDIDTLSVVGVKDIVSAVNKLDLSFMQSIVYHTVVDSTTGEHKKIITLTYKNGNTTDIDISAIITTTDIGELNNVDDTGIIDGQTLVYDMATGKFKPSTITGTDEKVKMSSSDTDSKYLNEYLDKVTVNVDNNNKIVAKTLYGLSTTIQELNYIQGLTMPVMDIINLLVNGGLKYIDTPFNTYADLSVYDTSTLLDNIGYIARVLADENHASKLTAYLVKKNEAPKFYGYLSESRDFTTNPIDLTTEITGKLSKEHIDLSDVLNALNISDEYKTLLTENKAFGVIGAYNLYQEILSKLGDKVNVTDIINDYKHVDIDKPVSAKVANDLYTLISDISNSVSGSVMIKKEFENVKANTENKFNSTLQLNGGYTTSVYAVGAGKTNLTGILKALESNTKQDFIKSDDFTIDDNGAKVKDKYTLNSSLNSDGLYEVSLSDFVNVSEITSEVID